MHAETTLTTYLDRWAGEVEERRAVADAVVALSHAGCEIASLVAMGDLAGTLGALTGRHCGADPQRMIDVAANDLIATRLSRSRIAALGSEEMEAPIDYDRDAPIVVVVDPIDGASNVDANMSVGTIFSILPTGGAPVSDATFLQPGVNQLAAGFLLYGPQLVLVLTVGAGTQVFTFDRERSHFLQTRADVAIPNKTCEYAINASNYRHWDEPIRAYVDDCMKGKGGPRTDDFNMRWTASFVADIYRILTRGGIYLYPADLRRDFVEGRIRLVYEANPIGWIMEQAGGRVTTGRDRLLEIVPRTLHQRVPLIAGSRAEVDHVVRLHVEPHADGERSPLFGRRGLFRM